LTPKQLLLKKCKNTSPYKGSLAKIIFSSEWNKNIDIILYDPGFILQHCQEPKTDEFFSYIQQINAS